MEMKSNQIVLAGKPAGQLTTDVFEHRTVDVASPGDGEVLVRGMLLSIDAAMRAWMSGPVVYHDGVGGGEVMHGRVLAEVVESRYPDLKPGDIVEADMGWQTLAVMPGKRLHHWPQPTEQLSHLMSLLGIAGKTAYHGLLNVAGIKEGETLLVSAAAGSVGSIVCQIGKIKGARVIGVAGGAEKCAWLKDELGVDAAVDYKAPKLTKAIAEAAPDGVDVYFDNTGGPILEAALRVMNNFGRISCCGAVSQYDTDNPQGARGVPGTIVVKRLRMQGFVVMDFADQDAQAEADLTAWAADGRLKVQEDIVDGLENAPEALIDLLAGGNRGKRMVRLVG